MHRGSGFHIFTFLVLINISSTAPNINEVVNKTKSMQQLKNKFN